MLYKKFLSKKYVFKKFSPRTYLTRRFVFLAILFAVFFYFRSIQQISKSLDDETVWDNAVFDQREIIHLVMTSCGSARAQETLNSIKSALMFTSRPISLYLFTEQSNIEMFTSNFSSWPQSIQDKLFVKFHQPEFPEKNRNEWRKFYSECSTQRLFLSNILKHVNMAIYIDADTIILADLASLWSQFEKFNDEQMIGVAWEAEDELVSYYKPSLPYPYFGKLGVNSGVCLLHLERMRKFGFEEHIDEIYASYKHMPLRYGDQCLLNIFLSKFSTKAFIINCAWNFRVEQCRYEKKCKCEDSQVKILHGSRQTFLKTNVFDEPAFRYIYSAINLYQFEPELRDRMYKSLSDKLDETIVASTSCGRVKDQFLKQIRVYSFPTI